MTSPVSAPPDMNTTPQLPARLGPAYRLLVTLLVMAALVATIYWLVGIGYLHDTSWALSVAITATIAREFSRSSGGLIDRLGLNGAIEDAVTDRTTALQGWFRGLGPLPYFGIRVAYTIGIVWTLKAALAALLAGLVNPWLGVATAAVLAAVVTAWDVIAARHGPTRTTPVPVEEEAQP